MVAVEYLRRHASGLKSGWFGDIKVQTKWSSAFAPAGPFGGAISFATVKGAIVEDQLLVRRLWDAVSDSNRHHSMDPLPNRGLQNAEAVLKLMHVHVSDLNPAHGWPPKQLA